MKKTIVAATIMAMTSGVALAESQGGYEPSVVTGNKGAGEVRFLGEVKAASCTITVANQANNATVTLPIINASEFKEAGVKYKRTKFDIVLSDCKDVGENQLAKVSWTEGELDNPVEGYLKNLATETPAKGVSLVISNFGDDTNIVPGTHVETQSGSTEHYSNKNSIASGTFDADKKTTTIPFTVAYVQTEKTTPVTAGLVESTAVYSVFYE